MIIIRSDFNEEHWEYVLVHGISCLFNDSRIDETTIPDNTHIYEVAGDDDIGDEPSRTKKRILVNFSETLVSEKPLPLDSEGVLWIDKPDEFKWLY